MKAPTKTMLKTLTPAIMAFAAFAALGPPLSHDAGAQTIMPQQCAPRKTALKNLASQFNEAPVQIGLTNAGAIVEVTTSEDGDSWSIILTTPQGISCIIAAGEHWEQVQPKTAKFTPSADERVH